MHLTENATVLNREKCSLQCHKRTDATLMSYTSKKPAITLMNGFIGVTMTIEYTAKSLISTPIRWFFSGSEPDNIQDITNDPNNYTNLCSFVHVKKSANKSGNKTIELPRYSNFMPALKDLCSHDVLVLEIAGSNTIAATVLLPNTHSLLVLQSGRLEYDWLDPQRLKKYAVVSVNVPNLKGFFQECNFLGIDIVRMHDF